MDHHNMVKTDIFYESDKNNLFAPLALDMLEVTYF